MLTHGGTFSVSADGASDGAGGSPRGAGTGPLTIKERRRLNPSRLSSVIIMVAVRALPPAHRDRYTREFYAEMFGLGRGRQLAHASGLVLHSTSLALALGDTNPALDAATPGKDWRCRLRRHHDVTRNNPDAETKEAAFYSQCTRCGRIFDRHASGYSTPLAL